MRERLTSIALIIAIVVVDQWTKAVARHVLLMSPKEFAGGLLSLVLAENEGAFLSLGASLSPGVRMIVFTIFVAAAVAVALVLLAAGRLRGGDAIAVAAIAGGGIGNLIDRLMRAGRVTDFIYLQAGPLHTGVFNVADMAITFAVVWLFVTSFRRRPGSR